LTVLFIETIQSAYYSDSLLDGPFLWRNIKKTELLQYSALLLS